MDLVFFLFTRSKPIELSVLWEVDGELTVLWEVELSVLWEVELLWEVDRE